MLRVLSFLLGVLTLLGAVGPDGLSAVGLAAILFLTVRVGV